MNETLELMDAQAVFRLRNLYAAVAFGAFTERGAINCSEILQDFIWSSSKASGMRATQKFVYS